MHGLFTRVFLSFWISIVLIAGGAAAVTAVSFVADRNNPVTLTRQAQSVLDAQGVAGLRSWLATRNAERHDAGGRSLRTLIFDESGREILGQSLPHRGPPPGPPPPRADQPRGFPRSRPDQPPGPPPPGMELRALDGARYRVVFDPPPRRGPFAPPFAAPVRVALLVLALGISGLVSYLLARSIARPLESLQGTARALSEGDLSVRPAPAIARRRDEIGTLARELDAMAQRLAAMIAARARLLRDISHELRSPLARLQLAVGLARQGAAGRLEPLARIEREGERLEALIAQVLEYARFERDPSSLQREDVDLGEMLEQIVHDAQFESQGAPERVTLALGGQAWNCRADRQVLHAAFDNVVRNALLHGGDGRIEVLVDHDESGLRVRVLDEGPGVPDADLARIFEPFYRVPRGASVPVEGSGIGLAVAQRAIALHGGGITAANRPKGGLEIEIRLPAA